MSDRKWPVNQLDFIGRCDDLAALQALSDDARPLITVVGPAGIGKTRLVTEWGAKGAWLWCDLSEARTREDIEAKVAHALDLRLAGPGLSSYLASSLAHAATGLVLDNAEHVAQPLGELLKQWRASASTTRFVVTSRQALRIPGETVLTLQPLRDEDARALFWQKARVARPSVQPSDDTLVAELVAKLDYLPLAIELAAGRMGVLSLHKLHERLSRRFETLRAVGDVTVARHHSLEQAIAWSWELLSEPERHVLAQCTVFHHTFSMEAAEAVVSALPASAPPIIDILQALHERGMLRTLYGQSDEGQAANADVRFAHYLSIRDFAAQTAPPDAVVHARHAAYFAGLGASLTDAHGQPTSDEAEARLAGEIDNLLVAHALVTGRQRDHAVALAVAASAVLQRRGPYELEQTLLQRAAEDVEHVDDATWRYRVAMATGESARWNCAFAHAATSAEQALKIARQSNVVALEARARLLLSRVMRDLGQIEEARPLSVVAAKLARQAGDDVGLAFALCDLGWIDRALAPLSDAQALLQKLGTHKRSEAFVACVRGAVCYDLDQLDAALDYLGHAVSLARASCDPRLESTCLLHLASVQLMLGRFDEASDVSARALLLQRRTGNLRYELMTLISRATAAHFQARWPEAEALLGEARRLAERVKSPWSESAVLAHASAIVAAQDRVKEAEALWRRAVQVGRSVNRPDFARFLDVHAGFIDVAKARGAEPKTAQRALAAAQRRLSEARDSETPGTLELRMSAALLEHALANSAARPSAKPVRAIDKIGRLEIGPAAEWVRVAGGARANLRQRQPLRRILLALVEQHDSFPGSALPPHALIDAGWPSEPMLATAAKNRLHNAVSSLRRFGMTGVLLTRTDGYLLDPRVDVARLRTEFQRA